MLILWIATIVALASQAIAAPKESQVALFLQPRDYLQQQYTKGPNPAADYVLIAGEPVLTSILLSNEADSDVRLDTSGLSPTELAKFVLVRRRAGTREQVPFRLQVVAEIKVHSPGQTRPAPWGDELELPYKGSLIVPVELRSDATSTPGTYELHVTGFSIGCAPDCRLRNQGGGFRFEVRPASDLAARVEVLTRRAWDAVIAHPDPAAAERALTELLTIYPQSVFGHQLRGELAETRKQWDVAGTEYDRALQVLMQQEDRLYIDARPEDVRGRIMSLRLRRGRAADNARR